MDIPGDKMEIHTDNCEQYTCSFCYRSLYAAVLFFVPVHVCLFICVFSLLLWPGRDVRLAVTPNATILQQSTLTLPEVHTSLAEEERRCHPSHFVGTSSENSPFCPCSFLFDAGDNSIFVSPPPKKMHGPFNFFFVFCSAALPYATQMPCLHCR